MSEYQYYEFLAVDRPLTQDEMAELRRLTTRAEITPTSLTNVYHWGDFKGDPYELVKKYFDAFLYVANWGTRRFMFRVPSNAVDEDAVVGYEAEETLTVSTAGDQLIVDFRCDEHPDESWVEGSGWMAPLAALRQAVLAGDSRSLYLGWLGGIYYGSMDDEQVEPPVPPGLRELPRSLAALVEFLGIDEDLLTVAAEASGPLCEPREESAALSEWVRGLPPGEKDDLLAAFIRNDGPGPRWELLRRSREASRPGEAVLQAPRRMVGELRARAEQVREVRRRAEAERRTAERARRRHEEAEARQRHLDALVGREDHLWGKAERLIQMRKPKEYDQTVALILDLRDLADRQAAKDDFAGHLFSLRERHHRKTTLLRRLDRAGLA